MAFRRIMFPGTLALTKLSKTNSLKIPNVCYLSLLECRSKEILQQHDVNIQKFKVVSGKQDATEVLQNFYAKEYVVKAQVLAGGRGLGHFDNGFKSGVHLTKDRNEIPKFLKNMINHRLITKQTPECGILVKEVMVAESVDIKKETYFCILLDRAYDGPVVIASPSGGTDIENIAEKTPHLIKTVPININQGITDEIAESISSFLQFSGEIHRKAVEEIKKLWKVFVAIDAVQVEINPLVITSENEVIALDAKIQCDDNASFRQKGIYESHDYSESDPKEVQAAAHNLNYISMDGNIGCLVNGAGLAMATMDIIKLHGGEPANFLDVGGNVNENQVYHAFHILTSDEKVKSILVNVFGGIVNCAIIAKGIVAATNNLGLRVPLTVRLEGTNVNEGRSILEKSGLNIQFASNLDEAAKKAITI